MDKLAIVFTMAGVLLLLGATSANAADAPLRMLFFSKSAAFEHSVVGERDGKPSWAGNVLSKLAEEMGATLTCTKDGGLINADNLKNYDIVIFYTQGDLMTEGGRDGTPAMSAQGLEDLLAWVRNGGRYFGFHCASDTFHTPEGGPVTPYLQMVGGEFCGHGAQFKGTLKIVDADHPTMAHIPQDWTINEEWYCFNNLNTDKIHVLALLDAGEERAKQKMYDTPNYPMIWCSQYGQGRVYFNGMGHREDVWINKTFKQSIVDAIEWLMAKGPAQAEPNFDQVVPKEIGE